MVQRGKGLRLHYRGRLRATTFLCTGPPSRSTGTAPSKRASAWSWKSAKAKRARRPKTSGPPSDTPRRPHALPGDCPTSDRNLDVRPHRRLGRRSLVRAVAVLALGGCSGSAGNARTASVEASGDGTLRIGLILDNTGPAGFLNAAQLAAAKLAVQEINAAGGHKGRPVELLPENTGADTAAQARELVDAKADVVIGPTDSSRAPAAIDVLSKAKVALISPANTAGGTEQVQQRRLLLPDRRRRRRPGRRPGETGQGRRRQEPRRGLRGRRLRHRTCPPPCAAAAKGAGLEPVTRSGFKPGEAQKAAAAAREAAPDAVVVIARDGAQGAIAELNNAGVPGSKLILSDGAFSAVRLGPGFQGARRRTGRRPRRLSFRALPG